MLLDPYEQSVYEVYKHVVSNKKSSVTLLKPIMKTVKVQGLHPFLIFNRGGYYRRWLVKVCLVSGKTKHYLYAIPYDLPIDDPFREFCQQKYPMLAEYTDFNLNEAKPQKTEVKPYLAIAHNLGAFNG